MKKYFIFSFIALFAFMVANAQYANSTLGQWQDHLSYYSTHAVYSTGNSIMVASESSLFYLNKQTKKMERFSKVNGLSDAGIKETAYDPQTGCTIITYDNSNIDIVQNGKVYNISDIKIRSIEGSKAINSIYFKDSKAYLSCGFGIVVLDLIRKEIFDTYYVGIDNAKIKVNNVLINDTAIFAGTVDGLLYAPKNSNALSTSETWKLVRNIANTGRDAYEINFLLQPNEREILIGVAKDNSTNSIVYLFDGENWTTAFNEQYIAKMRVCENTLILLAYRSINLYNVNNIKSGSEYLHISDEWNPVSGIKLDVNDVLLDGEDIWFAHDYEGLIHCTNYRNNLYNISKYFPDGPMSNDVFSLTASEDGKIYVAPGGKTIQNAPRGISANVYTFDGYYWQSLNRNAALDTIKDILNVTIDPRNPNHLMASSWWSGVVEILDNEVVNVYTENNTDSMLIPHPYCFRIARVEYDESANLLIANSMVQNAFCYLTYDNVWGNFETYSIIGDAEILGMTLDNRYHYKFLWTANNKILVLDNNGNRIILNPNNGSYDQTTKVNCIVQDMDGEMWIGTDKGIKVAYNIADIFESNDGVTSNTECQNIVYQEDGIAQYLLNFENVTCIMIDGGNRKWVGTERNGIYVLSPSGDEQIYHFTAENSPLISNRVLCMAQNGLNGEVFIGTDRGIVSYRAESINGMQEAGKLTAFPNPLRPHHSGTIAIKGFVADSDVRITDINGKAVAHLKSIGGQAVWDGTNFNGEKVASGVYLIFSSAEEGKQTATGKLMIIR
ncbi:MAG: hypothetical protein J6P97_05910 [Bacteroidales bacterium]|nr:hypothetical protein [Bacteroidales bacterium]